MLFRKLGMLSASFLFNESCSIFFSEKFSLRRISVRNSASSDIRPNPPICIRKMMTVWPIRLYWSITANGISPVTQVAEVATNKLFR